MSKPKGEPRPPFRWGVALAAAAAAGVVNAATAAGAAAVTVPEPTIIALLGGIGFAGGTVSSLAGGYVKHLLDDPSPVFDGPTKILFDAVGYIVCLLLFVFPAFGLDHALRPAAALPGSFGFAALFLSTFLMPVVRGLLINLGFARDADGREEARVR